MATAIVDMAFTEEQGANAYEAARAVGAEYGVEIEVLVEHGPGGGWPEVRLKGERAVLEQTLRTGWGMDDEQLADEVTWGE